MPLPSAPGRSQLFIIDPIERLRPTKDSSVALMQAAQRAGLAVWVASPADLSAALPAPAALPDSLPAPAGHSAWVQARRVHLEPMALVDGAWQLPEPWYRLESPQLLPLEPEVIGVVWMRKDPPVDEAYLYATHLLDLAERRGVRVLNRPAAVRGWNEKLGALRFSHLMAPSLVSSRVDQLAAFTAEQGEVVLKPLGGRAGQGVVFAAAATPGLRALLELVTAMEQLPVMAQAFLPGVRAGD